jgi:drug/metabolite transporter (DMT)-like permease
MVQDGLAAGAWLGNLAAFLSALGFAAFTVTLRWRHVEDSLPSSLLGSLFSVIAGGLVATYLDQPLAVAASDLMWCALMGVVTLSGGMILYTFGSKVVPSAELALLSNTEVMLAPFWVWLLMGETASAGTLAGGAILFAAIMFNASSGMRRLAQA